MKFTPKEIEGNINVSSTSPIKEFFVLLGGVMAIVLGIYIVLGFAVGLVLPYIPPEIENSLASLYSKPFENAAATSESMRVQALLDMLAQEQPEEEHRYTVAVVPNSQANAFAVPGGNIVIFSTLLEEVESENELAFVLAHELGHFVNRDHMRNLGRGLVLLTLAAVLLGEDNSVTQFILNSLTNVEMKFSQRQERAADRYALDLLNKRYGHVGGATDFMERVALSEKRGRFQYYFKSHPHPLDRIRALQDYISEKNYQGGETAPLKAGNNP